MPMMKRRTAQARIRPLVALLVSCVVATLGACGGGDDAVQSPQVVSSADITVPGVTGARASRFVHTMPSRQGGQTNASAILFVPQGTPPTGGWPVVAWAHGTTTVAHKNCAPSDTLVALDGGLTADGFPSRYNEVVARFVNAGYAVVAPDFEGIGQASNQPFAYYDSASESRSIIAAVQAAHRLGHALSPRWVAVGHSEGGRGVLMLQRYLAEANGLDFRGTVALAPFTNIAASVVQFEAMKAADPANALLYASVQNFFVGMFTTATRAATQGAAPAAADVMGADLQALLPTYQERCVFAAFNAVADAVVAANGAFVGLRADWSDNAAIADFLRRNDPGVVPDFAITQPTLVVQGTNDIFVLEPLATAFFGRQIQKGAPVTYTVFPGSDHGSIVIDAGADILGFIANRFSS